MSRGDYVLDSAVIKTDYVVAMVTNSFVMDAVLLDAQLGLGDPCDADDECADDAAQCRAGTCQCLDNYFIANDSRCGRTTCVIKLSSMGGLW